MRSSVRTTPTESIKTCRNDLMVIPVKEASNPPTQKKKKSRASLKMEGDDFTTPTLASTVTDDNEDDGKESVASKASNTTKRSSLSSCTKKFPKKKTVVTAAFSTFNDYNVSDDTESMTTKASSTRKQSSSSSSSCKKKKKENIDETESIGTKASSTTKKNKKENIDENESIPTTKRTSSCKKKKNKNIDEKNVGEESSAKLSSKTQPSKLSTKKKMNERNSPKETGILSSKELCDAVKNHYKPATRTVVGTSGATVLSNGANNVMNQETKPRASSSQTDISPFRHLHPSLVLDRLAKDRTPSFPKSHPVVARKNTTTHRRATSLVSSQRARHSNEPDNDKMESIFDLHRKVHQRYAAFKSIADTTGDPDAQFETGKCHAHGNGTPKDDDLAFKYYKLAAQQFHPGAMYELATCFRYSRTHKDEHMAEYWYDEAYRRSREMAAEERNPMAQFYFALCQYDRYRDEPTAFHYYSLSAEQGYGRAKYAVGLCYLHGNGVAQSNVLAVQCIIDASNLGHRDAQYDLGLLYCSEQQGPSPSSLGQQTQVLAKSYTQAIKWLTKSAVQGKALANLELTRLVKKLKSSTCAHNHDTQKALLYAKDNLILGNKVGVVSFYRQTRNDPSNHKKAVEREATDSISVVDQPFFRRERSGGNTSLDYRWSAHVDAGVVVDESLLDEYASRADLDNEIEHLEERRDAARRSLNLDVIKQGQIAEGRLPRLRSLRLRDKFRHPMELKRELGWWSQKLVQVKSQFNNNETKKTELDRIATKVKDLKERINHEMERTLALNRNHRLYFQAGQMAAGLPSQRKQEPSAHVDERVWNRLPFGWRPFDAFLILAGPQRRIAVQTLKDELNQGGVHCFLDGDKQCDDGDKYMEFALETSRYAIAVVSKDFLSRKDPCAELVYAYKRMKWINQRAGVDAWQSLYVILFDVSLEEFKEATKKNILLTDLEGITNTATIICFHCQDRYGSWGELQMNLLGQLQAHDDDNQAIRKWLLFLQRLRNQPDFEKPEGLYEKARKLSLLQRLDPWATRNFRNEQ